MRRPVKLSHLATAALVSVIGLSAISTSAAVPAIDQMRFRVLLDNKEIGYHTFAIRSEGDATVVKIKAEFDVRVLFISAYNYLHENVETWEGSCLRRIDSLTDDNGERFEVTGEKMDDSFELVTLGRSQSLKQNCVMTFAYWNRDFLSQSRLLNAQTGDYIEVDTEALGKRQFELADGVILANGYRVFSKDNDLNIKVWYEENSNRWLALESKVGSGKILRYLPANTVNLFSQVRPAQASRERS